MSYADECIAYGQRLLQAGLLHINRPVDHNEITGIDARGPNGKDVPFLVNADRNRDQGMGMG